ncbi:hypothetical protein, partial [Lysinibacillus mangiferihumi]|uniref:hypothetical protein n=1 Tax=Lysinibacillus mangiferihumi TaxID=1130819 RepID=UPI001F20FE89
AGFIYGLTKGPRGWSAFLHFYYKKIVAQTMALVCTTNVSMFLVLAVLAGVEQPFTTINKEARKQFTH